MADLNGSNWRLKDYEARGGYAIQFAMLGLTLDATNPADLVLFPAMDATADVPEISTACWDIWEG